VRRLQAIPKGHYGLPLSFTPVLLVACNFKAETVMVFDREGPGLTGLGYGFLEQLQDRYRYHNSLSHPIGVPTENLIHTNLGWCLPYKGQAWENGTVCGAVGSILILVKISGKFRPNWLFWKTEPNLPLLCKQHEPGMSRFIDWLIIYLFETDQRERN